MESARGQLSGQWVKAGYTDKLLDCKSAKAAFSLLSGYSAVTVSEVTNDTLWVVIGINNHEGMMGYLKTVSEDKPYRFLFC